MPVVLVGGVKTQRGYRKRCRRVGKAAARVEPCIPMGLAIGCAMRGKGGWGRPRFDEIGEMVAV